MPASVYFCNAHEEPIFAIYERGQENDKAPITTQRKINIFVDHISFFFNFQMSSLLAHLPALFVSLNDWSTWVPWESRHIGLFKIISTSYFSIKYGISLTKPDAWIVFREFTYFDYNYVFVRQYLENRTTYKLSVL